MGGDGLYVVFKLRLGASIPRSVGLSVCWLVCWSVLQKLQKIYKTLQNLTKRYKTFGKTVKEALAVCRSFLDGVVIFVLSFVKHAYVIHERSLTIAGFILLNATDMNGVA